MNSIFKKICRTIQSAVFPRFCVRCNQEGSLLCQACESAWQPSSLSLSTLREGHIASFNYADPVARALICAWKYEYDLSAWEFLQKKLGGSLSALEQLIATRSIETVVPLVLHKKRFCERGFDQAEEIALFISNQFNIPMKKLLMRVRSTGKQADREEGERIEYMKNNPFRLVVDDCSLASLPSVLLVDDVWTTGATARAGAQILKNGGIQNVLVYTLAKGK